MREVLKEAGDAAVLELPAAREAVRGGLWPGCRSPARAWQRLRRCRGAGCRIERVGSAARRSARPVEGVGRDVRLPGLRGWLAEQSVCTAGRVCGQEPHKSPSGRRTRARGGLTRLGRAAAGLRFPSVMLFAHASVGQRDAACRPARPTAPRRARTTPAPGRRCGRCPSGRPCARGCASPCPAWRPAADRARDRGPPCAAPRAASTSARSSMRSWAPEVAVLDAVGHELGDDELDLPRTAPVPEGRASTARRARTMLAASGGSR